MFSAPWLEPDADAEASDSGPAAIRLVPSSHRTAAADVLENHPFFAESCCFLLNRGEPVDLAEAVAANKVLRELAKRGVDSDGPPAHASPPPPSRASAVAVPIATTVVEQEVSGVHRSLVDCRFRPPGQVVAGEAAAVCVAVDNAHRVPTIAEQSSLFGLNAEQHAVFVVWAAAVLDRKLRAVRESDLSDSQSLVLGPARNAASDILGNQPQVIGYCAGEGGCGKSYVLKCLVDFAQKHSAAGKVRVVAYTGSAAAGIGSLCSTIHAGLGIGLHASVETLKQTKQADRNRWTEVGSCS